MATAKVGIVVSRNGNWVWRADADLDPALVMSLTDEQLKTVQKALPKLIESIVTEPPEPEPALSLPPTIRTKKK